MLKMLSTHQINDLRKEMGQRICFVRKKVHLTQEELGDMLGVDRCRISRVENRHALLSFDEIVAISFELGLSPSDLLKGIEAQEEPNILDEKIWL